MQSGMGAASLGMLYICRVAGRVCRKYARTHKRGTLTWSRSHIDMGMHTRTHTQAHVTHGHRHTNTRSLAQKSHRLPLMGLQQLL